MTKDVTTHVRRINSLIFLALTIIVAPACSPTAPGQPLSAEAKLSDMHWLFSQFDESYAPLEMKQQLHGFDYKALKNKYLQASQASKSNEEFFGLLYRFVSEFKDAHTSASLGNADLPGRAKTAYLGFRGVRKGDALLVTALMPSMEVAGSTFPVAKGDVITKIDGATLKETIASEMVKYRDLGQVEANFTYHMNHIFFRISTSGAMPVKDTAVLTIVRGARTFDVTLPWIVEDLFDFNQEQKALAAAAKSAKPKDATGEETQATFQIGFLTPSGKILQTLGSVFDGKKKDVAEILKLVRFTGFSFWDSFVFVETAPQWIASEAPGAPTPAKKQEFASPVLANLALSRKVPTDAIPVEFATTYPAYYTVEKSLDVQGVETGAVKNVGYILLDTFSPETATEEEVLDQFDKTLQRFKQVGVKDVVIDMINNGGGSLLLGMKLAQKLSPNKVVQPGIQFRLSNAWLDDFNAESRSGDRSREDREWFKRSYATMAEDLAKGQRLSRVMSVESLMGRPLEPNAKLDSRFNVVLLVNEMCASMCDIFTAILKDNGMATVVGTKTMGAGGNVVSHPMAPNSHLIVNQTESLIVRRDGSTYIENNGISPDVEMAVNESALDQYEPIRKAAFGKVLVQ